MTLHDLARRLTDEGQYACLQRLLARLQSRDAHAFEELSVVLERIGTLYSEEDYADFLRNDFHVEEDLFILGYLLECGKCVEINGYDDEWQELADLVRAAAGVDFKAADGEDAMEIFASLRQALPPDMTLLLFHADDYYEDQFFVFVLPEALLTGETVRSDYAAAIETN